MDRYARLAVIERRRDEGPDLVHDLVGHGIAADRCAAAVHHEERAGAALLPVVHIGKAEIEGKMHPAVRIELLLGHGVEAFRRLPVAFFELRPKPSRPQTDRIGGEALEASVLLDPKLEHGFKLEDADIDRRAEMDARRFKPRVEPGEVRRAAQRLARAELRLMFGALQIDVHPVDELPPLRREQEIDAADERKEKNGDKQVPQHRRSSATPIRPEDGV